MRLGRRIAQVIVKPAWARVGPIDDLVESLAAGRFVIERANFSKLRLEITSVANRVVNRVECGATIDGDCLVPRHARLQSYYVEKLIGQLRDPLPHRWCDRLFR